MDSARELWAKPDLCRDLWDNGVFMNSAIAASMLWQKPGQYGQATFVQSVPSGAFPRRGMCSGHPGHFAAIRKPTDLVGVCSTSGLRHGAPSAQASRW